MRTKIIIAALAVFILSVAVFNVCGGAVRDLLSPKVKCVFPEYTVYNGRTCLRIPKSAVYYGESGEMYVFTARESEKYREAAYEAAKIVITIFYDDGDGVYISPTYIPSGQKIVCETETSLEDGIRIVIES